MELHIINIECYYKYKIQYHIDSVDESLNIWWQFVQCTDDDYFQMQHFLPWPRWQKEWKKHFQLPSYLSLYCTKILESASLEIKR